MALRSKATHHNVEARVEKKMFPEKLFDMFHDEENAAYCHWKTSETGEEMIMIPSVPEFTRYVLPRYFEHRNMKTLLRQLNIYRFQRMGKGFCYLHPNFKRNQRHLLDAMKPSVPRKMNNTQKKASETDPRLIEALERNRVLRAQIEIAIKQYDEELIRTREAECKLKLLDTTLLAFGQRASVMAPMQSSIFRLNSNTGDQILNDLRAGRTTGDQHVVRHDIEEVNVDENPSFKRRKISQKILTTCDSEGKKSNQSKLETSYSHISDISVSSQILTKDKSGKGRKVTSSLTSSSL